VHVITNAYLWTYKSWLELVYWSFVDACVKCNDSVTFYPIVLHKECSAIDMIVLSITLCTVVKRYITQQKCLNKWIGTWFSNFQPLQRPWASRLKRASRLKLPKYQNFHAWNSYCQQFKLNLQNFQITVSASESSISRTSKLVTRLIWNLNVDVQSPGRFFGWFIITD